MSTLDELQRVQDHACMRRQAAWERIRAQLQFAEFLVEQHPDRATRFRAAVDAAAAAADQGLAAGSPDMESVVSAVESALVPLAPTAKTYTVYLAGHAHIDMNWMWSWPETVSVTLDTFRTMLDLMQEFPEFVFSQSQASVYRIVEEHAPELLAEIAARVKAGNWEVTASHWVEGDKNIAGGESLCRHLLYTRRYMQRLFGLKPGDVPIDWSPDTFGHAATLPSYLARGGVQYLFLHRPGNARQPVPEAFWWEAPDGSRVLVHNAQRRGYNCAIEPSQMLELIRAARTDGGLTFALGAFGVGDHGGGPTRRDLRMRREMDAWPVFPALRCGRSEHYFIRLAAEGGRLPVIRGELNYEFAGCYTTQTLIKRANRLGEARVSDAETAAALDRLARGAAYPAEAFETNWRRVLFSHFHDILPGSGVHDTRTYTHGQFQETMASTLALTTRALRGVAGIVDTARVAGPQPAPAAVPTLFLSGTRGGGAGIAAAEGRLSQYDTHDDSPARPFVVFNLTAVERREVVRLTIWDREPRGTPVRFHDKSFEAVDAQGRALPAQAIEKGKGWGHLNMTLAVPIEAPALGFTTVVLRETLSPATPAGDAAQLSKPHHCSYSAHERAPSGIENKHVRAQFDMQTGRIVSFLDKRTGLELVDAAAGGIGLEYSVERPRPMSAWSIEHSGAPERPALKSLREIHQGPYTVATEGVYAMRESTVRVVYRLDQDDPRLHVALDVDWFQRGSATEGVPNLRLAIPLALADAQASYEIPFGAVARDTPPDQEVPALRWAKVAGRIGETRAGMLVLNDCKHGHALAGSTLRVNLIRSAYEPDPLPEIGRHAMSFALVPVDADLSTAQATRLAQAFCAPLLPTGTGVHRGKLPPAATLIDVRGDDVVLSGIKFSEKGDGLIVRVYETAGAPAKAVVGIDPAIASPVEAKPVDLMERPLSDAAKPALTTRGVKFDVPAFGIGSVWIKTKRGKREGG